MVNSRDIKELYPEVAKKAQELIDLQKRAHRHHPYLDVP